MKILLCDDSKAVHAMMKVQLADGDFILESAMNSAELVAKFESLEDIDIIFLDWEMPQITGPQVLVFLRASGSRLPIFMLSGKNTESHIKEANKLGASGYIMKPFTQGLIMEAIGSLGTRGSS